MKNNIKQTLLVILLLVACSSNAQVEERGDFKPLNFRIYGGPQLQWMFKGENSTMRGGRLGFNSGAEVLFDLNATVELFTGLYFNETYFDRWINTGDSFGSSWGSERGTFFEIPLGAQFNFTKLKPSGFYAGIMYINSFTVASQSKKFVPKGNYEAQENTVKGTMGVYNFGFKGEIGYKFNYDDARRYSLSLGLKPMFYNYVGGKDSKYITFAPSLMFGVMF